MSFWEHAEYLTFDGATFVFLDRCNDYGLKFIGVMLSFLSEMLTAV